MYTYKALITDVYDGDSVTADIDLGFGVWLHKQKLRLSGIDAPEVRGESKKQGRVSRDALRGLILNKEVTMTSHKKGKYGRWISSIYINNIDVCSWLVENGYAEKREY